MTIHNLENPAYCEAIGLSKVFQAYAENCSCEPIETIGFNENSGYVYIALENGVIIGSCMGQDVTYILYDMMNGEEVFFDSYDHALQLA